MIKKILLFQNYPAGYVPDNLKNGLMSYGMLQHKRKSINSFFWSICELCSTAEFSVSKQNM